MTSVATLLSVKYIEYFYDDDSTLEVAMANRGQFDVTLDYVAFGFSGRYLRNFWHREALSLCSLSAIEDHAEDWIEHSQSDKEVCVTIKSQQ